MPPGYPEMSRTLCRFGLAKMVYASQIVSAFQKTMKPSLVRHSSIILCHFDLSDETFLFHVVDWFLSSRGLFKMVAKIVSRFLWIFTIRLGSSTSPLARSSPGKEFFWQAVNIHILLICVTTKIWYQLAQNFYPVYNTTFFSLLLCREYGSSSLSLSQLFSSAMPICDWWISFGRLRAVWRRKFSGP